MRSNPHGRSKQLALRLPVQAIYKFDDRRIVAGRIESGSLAPGDEIVIMPAGKIAKIKSVESWPVTPVKGSQARDARSASRSTANCLSSVAISSPMSAQRRATPGEFARAFSGCTTSR